jgi:hypothetical protein
MEVPEGNSLCSYLKKTQKCHFHLLFLYNIRIQEKEHVLPVGVITGRKENEVEKCSRRVNMVQILCTHVCK